MTNSSIKETFYTWIGEIPKHWKIVPAKRIAYIFVPQRNKPNLNEESGYPWITLEEVSQKFVGQFHKGLFVTDKAVLEAGSKPLESGSVVTGCVGTFGTASITRLEVIINQQLQAYIPQKVDAGFLRFCVLISESYFESVATSTTIAYVNRDGFAELPVPLPPQKEQIAIAAFLDRKTAAIDTLIAKKQRLIQLLKEKRAALINQAITKGLNPDVPMKDSGVPWIGEIPEHWEVSRLKFVCKLETGHTPRRSKDSYWVEEECTIPWVSLNDTKILAKTDYISATKYKISPKGMANSSAHLIKEGAVVFTRDATIGLAAITTQPMAVSQHIIAWVCLDKIHNFYLLHLIYSMRQELDRLTMGSTLKTIGMADVKELTTLVPPLEEQIIIANYLKEQKLKIDKTLAKVNLQIEKLQEYRQSLITAAVTGKLEIPIDEAA